MTRPIDLLRAELAKRNLDAFLVPHADEWQNEYQPARSARLAYISGFTGSAGIAVVTRDRAALFVDGRYTLQGAKQAPGFEQKHLVSDPYAAWLVDALPNGGKVGYDPKLITEQARSNLLAALEGSALELVAVETNPIDAVWHDRPAASTAAARAQPVEFAGVTAAYKRAQIAVDLSQLRSDALVVTAPDVIAWLFNLRGGDVAHTPVVMSTAIIRNDSTAELFVDPAKLDANLVLSLGNAVQVRPETEFASGLAALRDKTVLVDSTALSGWVFDQLRGAGAKLRSGTDPNLLRRARKNDAEIEGTRNAHRRDGCAVVRFLRWLETAENADELICADKLLEFRKAVPGFRDTSFHSISAVGPNSALPHYRSDETSNRKFERGTLYLIDSGGQYDDGTTDITRTVSIGEPTQEMRDRFTRVLKGHIAISAARFPVGTTGQQLDALARLHLWAVGCDYDHGTGHGVGSYLSVHEGPQRIAKQSSAVPLEPGMIISNEPGYYAAGRWGIRIENLVLVRPPEAVPGGDLPVMSFETLTLAPIARDLIDAALLTRDECDWLDAYHARVYALLADDLNKDERAWLAEATAPVR
ncbi:aminopeptidase P family protein [Roseiterribacter gracilis]|uniref:Xaa-Pro aminopeptidase n=1 Tax=Roseiterribacter gracilis TaxID=2812848 RepID=A0A8S8X9B9_9PROT|nr:Xaa-Pro aminopeptidase [Rhodospirillales bacterium TMPK1]